jgi:NADH-quinone oxidoreductase subunit C
MTFQEIKQTLITQFGADHFDSVESGPQPILSVTVEKLEAVCRFLHESDQLYFDFLSCITAIDNGPVPATMEIVYNLTSIPYEHHLMLKIRFPRNVEGQPLPTVPTVSHIWRTADWHEREAYDLLGIQFEGHPDLRRILLPEDWEGHPLRKDYDAQQRYHGIYVRYEDGNTDPDRA